MATFGDMSNRVFIEKGIGLVQRALALERSGEVAEALALYAQACQALELALKCSY